MGTVTSCFSREEKIEDGRGASPPAPRGAYEAPAKAAGGAAEGAGAAAVAASPLAKAPRAPGLSLDPDAQPFEVSGASPIGAAGGEGVWATTPAAPCAVQCNAVKMANGSIFGTVPTPPSCRSVSMPPSTPPAVAGLGAAEPPPPPKEAPKAAPTPPLLTIKPVGTQAQVVGKPVTINDLIQPVVPPGQVPFSAAARRGHHLELPEDGMALPGAPMHAWPAENKDHSMLWASAGYGTDWLADPAGQYAQGAAWAAAGQAWSWPQHATLPTPSTPPPQQPPVLPAGAGLVDRPAGLESPRTRLLKLCGAWQHPGDDLTEVATDLGKAVKEQDVGEAAAADESAPQLTREELLKQRLLAPPASAADVPPQVRLLRTQHGGG